MAKTMNDTDRVRELRAKAQACREILAQDLAAVEQRAAEEVARDRALRTDLRQPNGSTVSREELIEASARTVAAREAARVVRDAQDCAQRELREVEAELNADVDAKAATDELRTLREARAAKAATADQMRQLCADLDSEREALTDERKRTLEARAAAEVEARFAGRRLPPDVALGEIDRRIEANRATAEAAQDMARTATDAVAALAEKIAAAESRLHHARYQQALRDWRAAAEVATPAAARLIAARQAAGVPSLGASCEIVPPDEAIAAARTALDADVAPLRAVPAKSATKYAA